MNGAPDLRPDLAAVVRCARAGDYADCASRFNVCLIRLQSLFASRPLASAQTTELGRTLQTLLEAQTRKDWVAFADTVEYELEPLLARFGY